MKCNSYRWQKINTFFQHAQMRKVIACSTAWHSLLLPKLLPQWFRKVAWTWPIHVMATLSSMQRKAVHIFSTLCQRTRYIMMTTTVAQTFRLTTLNCQHQVTWTGLEASTFSTHLMKQVEVLQEPALVLWTKLRNTARSLCKKTAPSLCWWRHILMLFVTWTATETIIPQPPTGATGWWVNTTSTSVSATLLTVLSSLNLWRLMLLWFLQSRRLTILTNLPTAQKSPFHIKTMWTIPTSMMWKLPRWTPSTTLNSLMLKVCSRSKWILIASKLNQHHSLGRKCMKLWVTPTTLLIRRRAGICAWVLTACRMPIQLWFRTKMLKSTLSPTL